MAALGGTMSRHSTYKSDFDEDVPLSNHSPGECPECGGRVTTNTHETVCETCGLVIDADRIDHGPEWRNFDDQDENPERTGAPLTPARHDRGLSTEIGRRTDSHGNTLSPEKRRKLGRLRVQHKRALRQSKADRNQMFGLKDIRRMAHALGFGTGLRNQACRLFSTAQEAGLLRGRSIEGIAAASVYATVRCNGLPRTAAEIAALAKVDKERLEHSYQVLNRELGLPAEAVEPVAYIDSLASGVDLPRDVQRRARDLAEQATEAGIANGRKPAGVAAACLYKTAQAADVTVTQTALAEAADITPITLRARLDELETLV
jgi:transcription initiation factor TFIIB